MATRCTGFALVWVIVLLAVLAAAAAATAPSLAAMYDRVNVAQAYTMLAAIDTGINAFELNVHTGNITTNQFPGRISQLSIPIDVTSKNSCGNAMNGNAPTQWASTGPFIRFFADAGGVNTTLGRLQDSIERATPPGSNPLILRIPGTDLRLITIMDRVVDNGDGGSAGKILFDAAAADTTSLRYSVTPRQNNKC